MLQKTKLLIDYLIIFKLTIYITGYSVTGAFTVRCLFSDCPYEHKMHNNACLLSMGTNFMVCISDYLSVPLTSV